MSDAPPLSGSDAALAARDWPAEIYAALRAAGVTRSSFVPDAGHTRLISLLGQDPDVVSTVLTTEEEGIALATGAWLGGCRSVVLMQSSGVGNCINMLSLPALTRTPLLVLVTMRGEWGELNPWQMPMAHATEATLAAMGVRTMRVEAPDDAAPTVASAAAMAFGADQQVAVLLGQRLIGAKRW